MVDKFKYIFLGKRVLVAEVIKMKEAGAEMEAGTKTGKWFWPIVGLMCLLAAALSCYEYGSEQSGFGGIGNPSAEEIVYSEVLYKGAHAEWWIPFDSAGGANLSVSSDAFSGQYAAEVKIENDSAYRNASDFAGWMTVGRFWGNGCYELRGHYKSNVSSQLYAIRPYYSPFTGKTEREITLIATLPPAATYTAYAFEVPVVQEEYYFCQAIRQKGWLIVDDYDTEATFLTKLLWVLP